MVLIVARTYLDKGMNIYFKNLSFNCCIYDINMILCKEYFYKQSETRNKHWGGGGVDKKMNCA